MASCPTCGSTMAHFGNPPRDICPTPERHKASQGGMARGGQQTGSRNKGQSRPKSKDNLPNKKKGK